MLEVEYFIHFYFQVLENAVISKTRSGLGLLVQSPHCISSTNAATQLGKISSNYFLQEHINAVNPVRHCTQKLSVGKLRMGGKCQGCNSSALDFSTIFYSSMMK